MVLMKIQQNFAILEGEDAQMADPELQGFNVSTRINDRTETATVFTFTTNFFRFLALDLPEESMDPNLYVWRKICLCLALLRL